MSAHLAGMAQRSGLDRRTLRVSALSSFGLTASAPLTAVVGGIGGALAATQVAGIGLLFVVVTAALLLFTVGHTALVRHVPHAAPLYAQVARGLGPVRGVAAGFGVLVGYNAIQVCLYGLVGGALAGMPFPVPWWGWALGVWVLVGAAGQLRVRDAGAVLKWLLAVEVLVVVLFCGAALAAPKTGQLDLSALSPAHLRGAGVGFAVALVCASFTGFETGAVYAEEARSPEAATRATFVSLVAIGAMLTVASVAMVNATGAEDLDRAGASVVFGVLGGAFGPVVEGVANVLLVTSIVAAALSFHQTAGRYAFAMSRDQVLPGWLGSVRGTSGVPVGGLLAQSGVGLVVICGCAVFGVDGSTLFSFGAALAAVALTAVMAADSAAVVGFFRREAARARQESAWARVVAPAAGFVAMAAIVVFMASNLSSMLAEAGGVLAGWAVFVVASAAGVAGVVWGLRLRRVRPAVLAGVGRPADEVAETVNRFTDIVI